MYYSDIRKQLISIGFQESQISKYDLIPQFSWEKSYKQFIQNNYDRICNFHSSLFDEDSKRVLSYRLGFMITRKRELAVKARNIGNRRQYFDDTVYSINEINTIVDLGAYTGDSAEEFIRLKNGIFNRIYEFEPEDNYYSTIEELFKSDKRIICIKKGTSDKNGTIKVQSSLGVMNSISGGGICIRKY